MSNHSFDSVLEHITRNDKSVCNAQTLLMQLTLPLDLERQAYLINNGLSLLQASRVDAAVSIQGLATLREVIHQCVSSQATRLNELEGLNNEANEAKGHAISALEEAQGHNGHLMGAIRISQSEVSRLTFEKEELQQEFNSLCADLTAQVSQLKIENEHKRVQEEELRSMIRQLESRATTLKLAPPSPTPNVECSTQTDVCETGLASSTTQRSLRSSKRRLA